MIGMARTSGAILTGDAHLAQSVADILTTPIGSRVMRREYGSLLFELVVHLGVGLLKLSGFVLGALAGLGGVLGA